MSSVHLRLSRRGRSPIFPFPSVSYRIVLYCIVLYNVEVFTVLYFGVISMLRWFFLFYILHCRERILVLNIFIVSERSVLSLLWFLVNFIVYYNFSLNSIPIFFKSVHIQLKPIMSMM